MAASDGKTSSLKLLLVGSSNVGKSALLMRYCEGIYEPESVTATIGIDFKVKMLSVRGKPIRVTLFDTAGQERFRTLSTSYYRGAHGVILVYDISNRASFDALGRWFEEAESNTSPDVVMYLVGTKLDKADASRAVSTDEGKALARDRGMSFCEVSAKTGKNVRLPFVQIVDSILQKPELLATRRSDTVDVASSGEWTTGCSC